MQKSDLTDDCVGPQSSISPDSGQFSIDDVMVSSRSMVLIGPKLARRGETATEESSSPPGNKFFTATARRFGIKQKHDGIDEFGKHNISGFSLVYFLVYSIEKNGDDIRELRITKGKDREGRDGQADCYSLRVSNVHSLKKLSTYQLDSDRCGEGRSAADYDAILKATGQAIKRVTRYGNSFRDGGKQEEASARPQHLWTPVVEDATPDIPPFARGASFISGRLRHTWPQLLRIPGTLLIKTGLVVVESKSPSKTGLVVVESKSPSKTGLVVVESKSPSKTGLVVVESKSPSKTGLVVVESESPSKTGLVVVESESPSKTGLVVVESESPSKTGLVVVESKSPSKTGLVVVESESPSKTGLVVVESKSPSKTGLVVVESKSPSKTGLVVVENCEQ
ncbi:hypothetical protein RRG08_024495 [Elysia crispata]|uniref:Uncharacterized protein n=1 Tax=Elysia crispata TaxID=231223 RepID=A0AAE0YPQ6_9GAST|nr:hypothetical protein RRG08_024495 [Elysia crispata]